jgi:hypothetical protein
LSTSDDPGTPNILRIPESCQGDEGGLRGFNLMKDS